MQEKYIYPRNISDITILGIDFTKSEYPSIRDFIRYSAAKGFISLYIDHYIGGVNMGNFHAWSYIKIGENDLLIEDKIFSGCRSLESVVARMLEKIKSVACKIEQQTKYAKIGFNFQNR